MSAVPLNPWLIAGGVLSAAASIAHLACIAGGPRWYRFFGAGERIAQAAAAGEAMPALVTAAIAGLLALFAAYALSGAGVLPRLPLLMPVLIVVTLIYLARGAALFRPGLLGRPDLSPRFLFWSSAIVLAYGLVHLIGIWRGWADLNGDT